eukprot:g3522.t1
MCVRVGGRRTLFTDTLPRVWDADVTPYGRYERPQSAGGTVKGGARKKKKKKKRKRPNSAATSSSNLSRLPSARSQGSAYGVPSDYGDYARALANKRKRARLFLDNRGLRVNAQGDHIDGIVNDLRDLSKQKEDRSVDPELHTGNPHRTVLHRVARGPVEIMAEQHLQEDAQRKRQFLGAEKGDEEMDTSLHPEDDYSDSDSRSEIRSFASGHDEEGIVEESSFDQPLNFLMNGPHCLRHLPEGRIPWRLMLSGDMLPSDLFYHDLRHAKPILDLNLSNLNVSDDVIVKVITMDDGPHLALRKLRLQNCTRLTDTSILALSKCKAIRVLDVSGCNRLTDKGFVDFARTHSVLQHVDISGCVLVTHLGISALATGCRRLRTLIATGLDLDDVALRAFAKQSSVPFSAKLKHVDFSGSCERATDGSMMSVLKGLGEARYVSIAGAPHVTDVSMAPLSRSVFQSLRALDVARLNVGDAGLSWMAGGCMHGLRELNLNQCAAITDAGIGQISSKCTNLTCLSLAGCANITDAAIETLAVSLGPVGLVNPYRHYKIKAKNTVRRKRSAKLPGKGSGSNLLSAQEIAAADQEAEKDDDEKEERYASVASGLRVLDVSDCNQLTDHSLRSLGQNCDTLTTLVLVGVNNITNSGLTHLSNIGWRIRKRKAEQRQKENLALQKKYGGVERFPPHVQQEQLRKDKEPQYQPLLSLNLAGRFRVSNVGLNTHFGVARLTDKGVSRMILGNECKCASLTCLNFTGLANVGDLTMRAISKACGGTLTKLAVSGCGRISDDGVRALCGMFGLRRNNQGLPEISFHGIMALAAKFTRLCRLDVDGCENITRKQLLSM